MMDHAEKEDILSSAVDHDGDFIFVFAGDDEEIDHAKEEVSVVQDGWFLIDHSDSEQVILEKLEKL
jgi:hypothetical protein